MIDGITTILPVFLRNPGEAELSQLNRAIDSVLSQPCEIPHELLIVDDGSEAPVLPQREGVRIIRLLRNYGISFALNAGLTQARYNLIARIDADDLWRPGKLATQLALLQADPSLTLVASGMRLVHPDNPKLDRDELRGGDWSHALALSETIGCPFPHGSILARREIFKLLGGYPQAATLQHAEDFALWAQWLRFFKVAICDEVFLDYTISAGQISSRFAPEQERASTLAARPLDVLANRASIPEAVERIGSLTAFTAWRYYDHIVAAPELYESACKLFPDRAVHLERDIGTLLTDRFFLLQPT